VVCGGEGSDQLLLRVSIFLESSPCIDHSNNYGVLPMLASPWGVVLVLGEVHGPAGHMGQICHPAGLHSSLLVTFMSNEAVASSQGVLPSDTQPPCPLVRGFLMSSHAM
jgi:hypothetical protein